MSGAIKTLIGIKAVYRDLGEAKKFKRTKLDGKRAKNTKEENERHVSTIVKMSIDGLAVIKITEATNCSPSYINKIRNKFGLVSKEKITKKQAFIDLIRRAENFTYSVSSAALKLGVKPNVIYGIMASVPQVKRGTRKGEKSGLWYDRYEPNLISENRRKLG